MTIRAGRPRLILQVSVYPGRLRGAALRDQVAAVVRDEAPMPVSTKAVCAALGTYSKVTYWCGHADCADPDHRTVDTGWLHTADDVRPQLRRLERDGLVERHTPHGRNAVHFWRWTGPDTVPTPEEPT